MNAILKETATDAARRLSAAVLAKGYRFEALHEYRDADGAPVLWRIRLRHPETGDKWMRPMHWSGSGFALSEPPAPASGRTLYRLPELLAADASAPVFVVEGEKCADSLARLGLTVTTSGSASSADGADWQPLAGRSVIVWPDKDDAGAKYAEAVGARLSALGCAVQRIDVAALNLPDKGDCVDWMAEHPGAMAADVLGLPRTSARCESSPTPEPRGTDEPPSPLPPALLPVQPFPMEALPGAFRDWIGDVSERMQCPPDFIALPMLVAAGAMVARHGGVRAKQKDGWLEVPNLWGCIVGRPGAMKSPAMSEALFAIRRMEAQARQTYLQACDAHAINVLKAELRAEARKGKAKAELKKNINANLAPFLPEEAPAKPTELRLVVNDATVEKLGEILADNPGGVLAERDELASLLRNLAREEQATARGFMLTAWGGKDLYRWDRITRGSVVVPCARVAVIGGTQPGPLSELAREAAGGGDDGLLQRFLFAWPDASPDWVNCDRWPDRRAKDTVLALFSKLHDHAPEGMQADTYADGSPDGPAYLRFALGAGELFAEWHAELERRLRAGEMASALESALSKYRKHVPALALILHAIEGGGGAIGKTATIQALALAEYFESHTRRVFDSGQRPVIEAAHAVLRRLERGDLAAEGFTAREVYRPQWSGLREAAIVNEALTLLCEYRHLDAEVLETRGRDALVFRWRRIA